MMSKIASEPDQPPSYSTQEEHHEKQLHHDVMRTQFDPSSPKSPDTTANIKSVTLVFVKKTCSPVDGGAQTAALTKAVLATRREAYRAPLDVSYAEFAGRLLERLRKQFIIASSEEGGGRIFSVLDVCVDVTAAMVRGDEGREFLRVVDEEGWVAVRELMAQATGKVEIWLIFGVLEDEEGSVERKKMGKGRECVVQ